MGLTQVRPNSSLNGLDHQCLHLLKYYTLVAIDRTKSRIVALKALLAKQTNGENLSILSDVKAMVVARYQLEPTARSQRAHDVLRSSHGESTSGSLLSRH